MPVGLPILVDSMMRIGSLVSKLISEGRTEATDEEVAAATARRKTALSELEAELERRRAEGGS